MQIADLMSLSSPSNSAQKPGFDPAGGAFARHLDDFMPKGLEAEAWRRPDAPAEPDGQPVADREAFTDTPVINDRDDASHDQAPDDRETFDPAIDEPSDSDVNNDPRETDTAETDEVETASGDEDASDPESGTRTDKDAEDGDPADPAEPAETAVTPESDSDSNAGTTDDQGGTPEAETPGTEVPGTETGTAAPNFDPHTKGHGKPSAPNPAVDRSKGLEVAQAKAGDHVPDHTPVAAARKTASAQSGDPAPVTNSGGTSSDAKPSMQEDGVDLDGILLAAATLGPIGQSVAKPASSAAAAERGRATKTLAINPAAERAHEGEPGKVSPKPSQNVHAQAAKGVTADQNSGKGGAGGGQGGQGDAPAGGSQTAQTAQTTDSGTRAGQVPMDPAFKAALLNTTAYGPAQAATAGQMAEQFAGTPADPAATSSTSNGSAVAHAAKAAAPRPAFLPQQTTVANQVAVQLAQAAADGATKFSLRLHPAELGRVDVSLDISSDGRVSAVVLADRPETLELLRNDSRILENALGQAGLRADSNDLKFGLRDQRDDFANKDSRNGGKDPGLDPSLAESAITAGPWTGGPSVAGSGALDIHV